ncbi:hypothetical protein [Sinomicrobium weinanense]|uniref:Uncharacterized protein n=1 Tax=Sinomicrobium weinanense TaxID=2842200 RepID=A0A926JW75_9FLAO|nr:hypothetical protein [Sinomicrobium weinanense]MBC9798464.1 hypothetical protein [Sinomicrobium weinanense]MBU3126005.1 hypothetical protein [Sinomicrobium weinanense]
MKNYFFFIFSIFVNFSFPQQLSDLEIRYSYTGRPPIVALNKSNDFIYKSSDSSLIRFEQTNHKYFEKKTGEYLFSEIYNTSQKVYLDIDVFLTDNSFKKKSFYKKHNFKSFPMEIKGNLSDNNYKVSYSFKKNKIIEYFIDLSNGKYIRLVLNTNRDGFPNILDKNKLFVGFKGFINQHKKYPSKILEFLERFFPKDYDAQIDLINTLDNEGYTTNSPYGSFLVDLNTNNGTFDNVKDLITSRRRISIQKQKLQNLKSFIGEVADSCDIMMFNEFHSYPHTRFNFMYTLQILKSRGFEYLALETLPPPQPNDSLIFPIDSISGYYVAEPTCSLMINYAANLGYKLVAYEEADQCESLHGLNSSNCRDSIQALNITRIFKKDPNAKVLVFGGHAHIEKKARHDWKFMRVDLQERFPEKKIYSIGQTKYIRTNLDSIDISNREPVIYVDNDGQFDAHMISPYYKRYYEWYYRPSEFMNRKISINLEKDFNCIEIIPVIKGKEIYYPIFRSKKETLQGDTIYLPENINYEVIYKGKNNDRL